jgi:hypothetical protein
MKLNLKENVQNSNKHQALFTSDSQNKWKLYAGGDTPAFRGNRNLETPQTEKPAQPYDAKHYLENEEQKVTSELKDLDLQISQRLKQS